jgi:phosphoribosyl-ATP pyrophosphohydrolase/phosphoribosyl-AMP cyclohydrolase
MNLKFNEQGLIPVIVQDEETLEVLMLAYMNQAAYDQTVALGEMVYFSRSRQELWRKGETSGNKQLLKRLSYDCDQDTLLAIVKQVGVACHTGNKSCFYRDIMNKKIAKDKVIETLYNTIKSKLDTPDGGYTNYLFDEGLDKILKKIAEEAGEVIIASKNNKQELIYELSDLVYHSLVLMVNQDIALKDIENELIGRRK